MSVTALLIISKGLDINPKNVWAQNIAVNSKNVSVFNKAVSYLEPMCLYVSSVNCGSVLWSLVVHKEVERGERRFQSLSFRPQGRRHSWPRSWIHLFDTKGRDNEVINTNINKAL